MLFSTTKSAMIDVARAREETPGCKHVTHFNNAGAALMPDIVVNTVIRHLQDEARIGGYEAVHLHRERIQSVYSSVARLLNCQESEVALVENATRAWDMAFYSIPFQPGDRILTTQSEYASNLIAYLQVARRYKVVVDIVPSDESGQVSVAALKAMMDDRVRLVAVTHIPTNGGLINPAAEIGQITNEWNTLYLLDACQSVGQLPIDVTEIGCDMLSATSRKYLRGPRGVGFLYVRNALIERLEPPFLDLHAAHLVSSDRYDIAPNARRFENWESNVAGKLGLGAAIDYALAWGVPNIWERVQVLATNLRTQLAAVPGVTVHDLGRVRCGIVSFTTERLRADEIRSALLRHRINVNVSRAPSTPLDMNLRGIDELIRASVHYYNDGEEIERFCETLASITSAVSA